MSIFGLTCSAGTPTANEHNPRPSSPIWRWPSSLDVAPQIGGCGFCSGLGSTRRCGIDQYLPSNEYSSFVQQPTTWPIASCHISRVSPGSIAEALELGTRRRTSGAEVDASVADQVEDGDRLGGAHRVVVRLRHEPDAVPEPDPFGLARRSRRRAPRGWSSASTPRGSGARPSRRRPTRSARRRRPARSCSGTRGVRSPASTGGRPGSRRTVRSARELPTRLPTQGAKGWGASTDARSL